MQKRKTIFEGKAIIIIECTAVSGKVAKYFREELRTQT